MSNEPGSPWYHEDLPRFRGALTLTEAETGFSSRLIEKDYYCSLLLDDLPGPFQQGLVFKGGTCLSKVHAEFFRLSEDLDFCISVRPGADENLAVTAMLGAPLQIVFCCTPDRGRCYLSPPCKGGVRGGGQGISSTLSGGYQRQSRGSSGPEPPTRRRFRSGGLPMWSQRHRAAYEAPVSPGPPPLAPLCKGGGKEARRNGKQAFSSMMYVRRRRIMKRPIRSEDIAQPPKCPSNSTDWALDPVLMLKSLLSWVVWMLLTATVAGLTMGSVSMLGCGQSPDELEKVLESPLRTDIQLYSRNS
jgi:Nucleotidyl transferase AbiEii toxin, Type IV TA system